MRCVAALRQPIVTGRHTAALIRGFRLPPATIYADSAEPKSIAELRSHGINITGASKGKGSIIYGIALLQEKPFSVTARSLNLIKELRSYTWATDRNGQAYRCTNTRF